MTENDVLNLAKLNNPYSSDAYDAEALQWIQAAERDIYNTTGRPADLDDPVHRGMILMYCRAHFGEGDRTALERYQSMLIKLGIQETY